MKMQLTHLWKLAFPFKKILAEKKLLTKWNPICQVYGKGLCSGCQGWNGSKWGTWCAQFSTFSLPSCVEVYLHLSPNWIAVYFKIAFCEFPSFLRCVSVHRIHPHKLFHGDQSCTSHFHTIRQNWHSNSNSALLCIKISSTIKDKDILLRILPMWAMNVIYLGSSFCIKIQKGFIFLQNMEFEEKRHASNFERDLFYFQLTSRIPHGIQGIRTHIGCLSYISSVLSQASNMSNSNMKLPMAI